MSLWEVALTAFVPLITMVNPLAVIPPFLALTDGPLRTKRGEVAFVAGLGTIGFLVFFLLAGNFVFRFFGITLPAFQIMGGIVFFTNALRTLVDDDRRFRNLRPKGPEEVALAPLNADPATVAIVPLAIPMLCGPGAITSTMLLVNLYPGLDAAPRDHRRDRCGRGDRLDRARRRDADLARHGGAGADGLHQGHGPPARRDRRAIRPQRDQAGDGRDHERGGIGAFSVLRSPFSVLRSSFSVLRSPFSVLRSLFALRSPFFVLRPSLSVLRCPRRFPFIPVDRRMSEPGSGDTMRRRWRLTTVSRPSHPPAAVLPMCCRFAARPTEAEGNRRDDSDSTRERVRRLVVSREALSHDRTRRRGDRPRRRDRGGRSCPW